MICVFRLDGRMTLIFGNTGMRNLYWLQLSLLSILFALVLPACTSETEEIRSGSALLVPVVSVDPLVYTSQGPVSEGVIENVPEARQLALRVTSSSGQYSATWPSLEEYSAREPYRPGTYVVEAFSDVAAGEGFDTPYFYGLTPVMMESGATAQANIKCTLANAVFDIIFSDEFCSAFSDATAMVHCEGGGYFPFPPEESRKAYLRAGRTYIYLTLTLPSGESAEFLSTVMETQEQHLYSLAFDADLSGSYPVVIVSSDSSTTSDDIRIVLTPEFLASAAPELLPVGFEPSQPISLIEGDVPQTPVGITLSGAPAESLLLSVSANSITSRGWPDEIDLAKASDSEIADLKELGLKITRSGGVISSVDLTDALAYLRSYDSHASFTFLAMSADGKVSGPLALNVDVEPAQLSVISVSDVVMGLDLAQIKLLSSSSDLVDNIAFETQTDGQAGWSRAEVISLEKYESRPGEWDAMIRIDHTSASTLELRILYCGSEVDRKKIKQIAPKSVNSVDAYSKLAVIRVAAEDPDMLELIVSQSKVYLNGSLWRAVTHQPENGLIIVGGLNPSSRYELKTTLFEDPSGVSGAFSNAVTFETESATQLPNGSFEEVDDGVNYKNLPSGGRYSQNIVDIYNQQNYTSFSGYVPRSWANVNSKTFCTSARNHNTWYMYPSTVTITDATDGAYAVCLQTTSFDVNGPAIADYLQTSTPYVGYSRNIPEIAHKAAGKIFLGSYSFNPSTLEETYVEGIEFRSRPTSLNGYYRFVPSLADIYDAGLIQVEIIGSVNNADIVISRATLRLTPVTGYTAFTIPLTYTHFGVKAKRLKVMVSSSDSPGSIAHETETIITYPDPETSTSHGGTLWIDNLTFSY